MHYKGYHNSRAEVLRMDRQGLIDLIESLYGWDHHEDGIAEDEVAEAEDDRLRREALLQHDWDWTIPPQRLPMFAEWEE
jgi:hypothetical protein